MLSENIARYASYCCVFFPNNALLSNEKRPITNACSKDCKAHYISSYDCKRSLCQTSCLLKDLYTSLINHFSLCNAYPLKHFDIPPLN